MSVNNNITGIYNPKMKSDNQIKDEVFRILKRPRVNTLNNVISLLDKGELGKPPCWKGCV